MAIAFVKQTVGSAAAGAGPAIDSSSPAGVSGTTNPSLTTASFTPPAGALILLMLNTDGTPDFNAITISDSLSGSWTRVVNSAANFGVGIYRRIDTTTNVAMTCTVTGDHNFATGFKVLVITGQDPTNPIRSSAQNSGINTVPTLTWTTLSDNSLVVGTATADQAITYTAITGTTFQFTWAGGAGTARGFTTRLNGNKTPPGSVTLGANETATVGWSLLGVEVPAPGATATASVTSTVGNCLVALVTRGGFFDAGALTGVTDSAGNAWARVTRGGGIAATNNVAIEAWHATNAKAVTSITFQSNSPQSWAWNVSEFSGIAVTSAVDVFTPDYSSVTPALTIIDTPLLTTNNNEDLVVYATHYPQTTGTLYNPNILDSNTSGMENDISGWAATSGCTILQDTTQAHSGLASLKLTSTAAANMFSNMTNAFPVTASTATLAYAWFKAATTARTSRVGVLWYSDLAGTALISQVDGTLTLTSTSVWTQLSVTATSPVNAVSARVQVFVDGPPASSESHFVDDVALQQVGTAALTNFDDATAGSGRAHFNIVTQTGAYRATWLLGAAKQAGVLAFALKAVGAIQPPPQAAVGTLILRPPERGVSSYYRLESRDKSGKLMAVLPYQNLQFEILLNEIDSLRTDMFRTDPKAVKANAEVGVHELWLWRADVLIWAGPLWSVTGTTDQNVLHLEAKELLSYFQYRVIDAKKSYLTTDNGGNIAQDLVTWTQAKAFGDLHIAVDGSQTTTHGYTTTFQPWERKTVLEAIQELSNNDVTGFDFDIAPTRIFKTYIQKGTVRPGLLEYGVNFTTYTMPQFGSTVRNQIGVTGAGDEENMQIATVGDTNSKLKYGLMEGTHDFATAKNIQSLTNRGNFWLQKEKQALSVPALTLQGRRLPFLGTFQTGDQIHIRIQNGYDQYDKTVRITGFQVTVGANDQESVNIFVDIEEPV